MKNIEFLVDMAYNDKGEVVSVKELDDEYVYYNDGANRWTGLPLSEEGVEFKFTDEESQETIEIQVATLNRWIIMMEGGDISEMFTELVEFRDEHN